MFRKTYVDSGVLAINWDYLIHRHARTDTHARARAAWPSWNSFGKAWNSRSGVIWKAPRVECGSFSNSLWAFGDTAAVTITLCAQVILSNRINHGVLVIIVNDDTRVGPPAVCCAPHRLRKRRRTFFYHLLQVKFAYSHGVNWWITRAYTMNTTHFTLSYYYCYFKIRWNIF